MSGVRVEPAITLGNILTIIAIVLGIAGSNAALSNRITALEVKVDPLYDLFIGGKR